MIVPPLIRMSGTLRDASSKPLTGTAGVTFALYKEQEGGEALWIETQNVSLDSSGRYNVLMGATRAEGVPMEVFTSGDARWLEVSVQGRAPQPRVLLVSVPYALKAQEAETLAGKPASQYVSADILKQQVHQEVQAEMQSGTAGSASRKTQISSPNAATSSGATNFSGSTADQIVSVTQTGAGYGINAVAASNIGVLGVSKGANGAGVYGIANSTAAGTSYGLRGDSYAVSGRGMRGVAFGSNGNLAESRATTGVNAAIYAIDNSPAGIAGIFDNRGGGKILSLRSNGAEVAGVSGAGTFTVTAASATSGTTGNGASAIVASGGNAGSVQGGFGGSGIVGQGGAGETGIFGSAGNPGVGATFTGGASLSCMGNGCGADAISAFPGKNPGGSVAGLAGNFFGDIEVTGAILAGTKDFRIDHPLDPANKYLMHASVESSEMMNIYTGNVTTDGQGQASVLLADWFEVLNADFRYQLTVIGQFAQAVVARKIANHQFGIRTDKPNVEVSWQVTCVRHDAFARANPLVVERPKVGRERGYYIHPELYGAPEERQMEWTRHPQMMRQLQQMKEEQVQGAKREN